MFETKYSGKTPKKCGEQESKKYAPDGAAPEYQQVGSSRTYGNRTSPKGPDRRHKNHHKMRGPYLNGGGDKQVSAHYANKTHGSFGTEGARNTLVAPMSRPPKAK